MEAWRQVVLTQAGGRGRGRGSAHRLQTGCRQLALRALWGSLRGACSCLRPHSGPENQGMKFKLGGEEALRETNRKSKRIANVKGGRQEEEKKEVECGTTAV